MGDPMVVGVVAVVLLAVAATLTIVGRRRGPSPMPIDQHLPDEERTPVPTAIGPPVEPAPAPSWREIDPDHQAIDRRRFLSRTMLVASALWIAGLATAVASFLWPRVRVGFGGDIEVGDADDILRRVLAADGTVTPMFVPTARAWIVPMPAKALPSSQFAANATVAGGLSALFQTCVHLGCRVPWCQSSQGFECPCHASKYNAVGERFDGPAPRNLDRFVVRVDGDNRFIVSTGDLVETPRTQRKSVAYPVGPFCVEAAGEG